MVDANFSRMMRNYGLTTAEIVYRMPDYHDILQMYVWQDYDLAPEFPELKHFLDFWKNTLDGPLYCVRIAHSQLIKPVEFNISTFLS